MDEADEPALRKVGGKARGGCGERLQLASELCVDALIFAAFQTPNVRQERIRRKRY